VVTLDGIESVEPNGVVVSFILPDAQIFGTSATNVMAKFCRFIFFFSSGRPVNAGPSSIPAHFCNAHTFASFYRGDDLAIGVVRPATISWLPATGAVQLFGAERGYNFSLGQTLRMACRSRRKVKAWGPYEVKAELFRSALRRIQVLESGQIRYSMINALPRSMNCITAAGDITPVPLDTGILWGDAATAEVVRHLSPYFVGEGSTTLKGLAAISTAKACPGQAGQVASSANKVSIP
jgi:hypothetical protein